MTKLRSFRTRRTQYINENLEDVDVEEGSCGRMDCPD